MARKSSSCAICENSNLASVCADCVNYRLSDAYNSLKSLKSTRDSLYSILDEKLVEKLQKSRVELLEKFYTNLIYTQNLGYMEITSECIHKQLVVIKQICKLFPMH